MLLVTNCSSGCLLSPANPQPEPSAPPAAPSPLSSAPLKSTPIASSPSALALMKDVARRPAGNARSPIGTNLTMPNYGSQDWAFLNSMRAGAPFVSVGEKWDDGRPIPLDDHGYPKRLLDGQSAVSIVPTLHGGDMVLTYEGQGNIRLEASDGSLKETDRKPGRIAFNVSRHEEIHLWITATDPSNPVRSLRLVPKRYEELNAVFYPEYLDSLAPFKVLRFMDWASTNHQRMQRWSERSRPEWFTQATDSGVAYEYMVRLGNAVRADIWVCVPHLADDEFVTQMAQVIARGLDDDLKVYVEYSNEIWNGIFAQAHYAIAQGKERRLARNDFQAGARFQSQRTVEIMKIFEKAFEKRPQSLVRVMASQVGNKWHHAELLEWKDAKDHIDALAVAPYFGHGWGQPDNAELMKKTETGKLMKMVQDQSMGEAIEAIQLSTKYAKSTSIPLIAYEGGQHIIASPEVHNDPVLDEKLNELQRHPHMGKLYDDLLTTWKDQGGQLFVNFTFVQPNSKWSKWGVLESQDQPREQAPKYDALLSFAERNPRWW